MNPGKLDHLVSIRRLDTTLNAIGEVVSTWSHVAYVWAEWLPQTGKEYVAAQTFIAQAAGVLRIRWRSDILETWRVAVSGALYEVAAPPVPVGRRGFLDLVLTSVPVSDPGWPLVNVFEVALPVGSVGINVHFPAVFQSPPQGLYIQLLVPTGQGSFTIEVGTPTADGVAVTFGAAVPAPGYKLSVMAFQYQMSYFEPLEEGTSSKVVSFSAAFPIAPRGVKVTLMPPSDGYEFTTALVVKSLTAAGFTMEYGATVPGPNYQVLVQVSL